MSRNNKTHRKTRYKKLIKKFPCKECITLAICVNKFFDTYDAYYYENRIQPMSDQCSLLREYIETDVHQSPPRRCKHNNDLISTTRIKPQLYNKHTREALVLKFFYAQCQKDRESILK